jgi:hypothetical protein
MRRWLVWLGLFLLGAGAGCAGDEKGVNYNKEKPQPGAK